MPMQVAYAAPFRAGGYQKGATIGQKGSEALMERVFSILRVCMDERQESCYSDRIAASTLLKYNSRKPGR